jgi:hypothetical protein
MGLDLLVDVGELGIAVGMLLAFQRLSGALQAEATAAKKVAHGGRGDRMALRGQLGGQMPQRLRRPAQRRHRISPRVRLDQFQQGRRQLRVVRGDRLTSSAGSPRSPGRQRLLAGVQLAHAAAHRGGADPGRIRDRGHAPVSQQPGLAGQRHPLLPLVQMRQQHLEPGRELTADLVVDAHSRSSTPHPGNDSLIPDGPSGCGSAARPRRAGSRRSPRPARGAHRRSPAAPRSGRGRSGRGRRPASRRRPRRR